MPAPGSGRSAEGPCKETFQRGIRELSAEYERLFSLNAHLVAENQRLTDLLVSATQDVAGELRDLDSFAPDEHYHFSNGSMPAIKELSCSDQRCSAKSTHATSGISASTLSGQQVHADKAGRESLNFIITPPRQPLQEGLWPLKDADRKVSLKDGPEFADPQVFAGVAGPAFTSGHQDVGGGSKRSVALRETGTTPAAPVREGTVSVIGSAALERMSLKDPALHLYSRGRSLTNTQNRQQLEDQFDRLVLEQGENGGHHLSAWTCWEIAKKSTSPFPDLGNVQEALMVLASMTERSIGIAMSRDLALGFSQEVNAVTALRADNDFVDSSFLEFQHFLHLMQEMHFKELPSVGVWRTLAQLKAAFKQEANQHALARTKTALELRKDGGVVHETQLPPRIAIWLDLIPSCVIIINALVIGVTSDLESQGFMWDIAELCFVSFYTAEVIVKLYLLGWQTYFRGRERLWNYFDLFCLSTSIADLILSYTWNRDTDNKGGGTHRLIKMLRLGRVARLVRTLRFKLFHELKMMVYGVVSGVRVLFWAIVLLFSTVYFIGVIMQNLIGEDQAEFESVDGSMFTVFRCFTDGCTDRDGTPLHERLRQKYGLLFFIGYILVFMFVTVGIFNLIMAIFIDNVLTSHMQRKQQELGENELKVRVQMEELLSELLIDVHGPVKSSKPRYGGLSQVAKRASMRVIERVENAEVKQKSLEDRHGEAGRVLQQMHEEGLQVPREVFNKWLEDSEMLQMLEDADIDTALKKEIFDALDVDSGGFLGIDELLLGLMKLRGPISKVDIVAARLKAGYIAEKVDEIGDMVTILVQCFGVKMEHLPSHVQKIHV